MALFDDIDKDKVADYLRSAMAAHHTKFMDQLFAVAPPMPSKQNLTFNVLKNRPTIHPNNLTFTLEDNNMTKGITDQKELVLSAVEDLVANFLYDDRQEDKELPARAIESAIMYQHVTVDEIVEQFKTSLLEGLDE